MKPTATYVSIGRAMLIAATLLSTPPAFAQEDVAKKWSPHFDMQLQPGLHRSLMEGDLFLPVSQNADTLVFGDLRARFDDEGAHEGNFGLGLRRMINEDWILGGYGFYDRQTSALGSRFDQATAGFEALGRNWDFRANAYVPFGSTASTVEGGGATGSPTVQLANNALVLTLPAGGREERALPGFDAEVGWRVPVFDTEAGKQLRLYAGGYRFEHDALLVTGPRVRAEFVIDQVPGFWKGARFSAGLEYQDDNVRGSQSYAVLRLRVPFGGRDDAQVLTAQERRMTAPVVRDIDIVTQTRSSGSGKATTEAVTQTADGKPLKVFTDDATTGAALPGAVSAAGANSTVLLSGTFNTTSTITLQAGQTLVGAGTLSVKTTSGQAVSVTNPHRAAINGNAIQVIAMANDTIVRGLTITQSSSGIASGTGLYASNNSRLLVENSVITATTSSGTASGVSFSGGSDITIRNSTISATATSAGGSRAISANGVTDLLIAGNTVSNQDFYGGGAIILNNTGIATGSAGNSGTCQTFGTVTGTISFTDGSHCP
ncbi:MAG TPA: inverse autotransporter beta domain-containing protein [Burkholderiales bacterium]|nr:inverse autotransporter beta domain-containing protein [Burkholderiales bacterium]